MPVEKQENRAFQEMRKVAVARLMNRDVGKIAEHTKLTYDARTGILSLSSLGQEVRIRCSDWEITPELDDWHHLMLLHYLDMADGTPATGELMRFGDLPGGMVRGGGFDRDSEQILSRDWGTRPLRLVESACRALGGRIVPSNADLCAVFDLFPLYPMTLKLWFADEEMPGSGRLLLDKSASHFLSVEDAVTAGDLLLEKLSQQYRLLQEETAAEK